MPKKTILIFLSLFLLYGCESANKKPPAAIKIDNIEITAAEYRNAFKDSPYASSVAPDAGKEFLNNYITRMLILREAERTGMDKNPEFLKNVQFFWQQSLIKLVLDKKIKEIALHIKVSDSEVKDYYQANKDAEFKAQDLAAVYDQIKWLILNRKQKALSDDWVNSLHSESKISVNKSLLKIGE